MKIKEVVIRELIEQIDEILSLLQKQEKGGRSMIDKATKEYRKSAKNLIHYSALRTVDLRGVQKKLKNLGMSRLANSASHVKASLMLSRRLLCGLIGQDASNEVKSGLSIKNSRKLLNRHTKQLLGNRSKGRRVRMMVTLPTEAAYNYALVLDMIKSGMNCARINCAHDDPEVWRKIINNVKQASEAVGRKVKITMDLAGPKLRTGPITPGPKVRKFSPERDDSGNVLSPALIVFVDEINFESEPNMIPLDAEWRNQLRAGDILRVTDTRNKDRKLKVIQVMEDQVRVNCYDTSYLGTGTMLRPERSDLRPIAVGDIPPIEQAIFLRLDDLITIHKKDSYGEPALLDEDGNVLKQAHVSCMESKVFDKVKIGDTILFDDGKITGTIEKCESDSFEVRIVRAKEQGSKLKAEKGINFPVSDLGISGLTEKDKRDLPFIAEHADVVNFSFVNSKEDVEELLSELDKLGARDKLSIILKIETRKAFDNLTEILLTAMQIRYIGVMIARGDLAVETGWDHIGLVQKEIIGICDSAHIPVVWATQVLESLAKKGLPSRSEITDATTALKAECVMLNKGNYILDAIRLLDKILKDMENSEDKNETMLPQLERLLK